MFAPTVDLTIVFHIAAALTVVANGGEKTGVRVIDHGPTFQVNRLASLAILCLKTVERNAFPRRHWQAAALRIPDRFLRTPGTARLGLNARSENPWHPPR